MPGVFLDARSLDVMQNTIIIKFARIVFLSLVQTPPRIAVQPRLPLAIATPRHNISKQSNTYSTYLLARSHAIQDSRPVRWRNTDSLWCAAGDGNLNTQTRALQPFSSGITHSATLLQPSSSPVRFEKIPSHPRSRHIQ